MSRFLFLLCVLCVNLSTLCAQNLKEKQSIASKALGESVNYSIYFPPNYDATNRYYPVTYVLHGYTDDETAWVQFGEIDRQADAAILSGEIPPMILVMPDAKVTWYVNDAAGKNATKTFSLENSSHILIGLIGHARRKNLEESQACQWAVMAHFYMR